MTTPGELGRPSPTTPAYTAHSLSAALPVALLRRHTHAAGLLAAPMVLAARAHTPATISAPLHQHINAFLLPLTHKCTATVYLLTNHPAHRWRAQPRSLSSFTAIVIQRSSPSLSSLSLVTVHSLLQPHPNPTTVHKHRRSKILFDYSCHLPAPHVRFHAHKLPVRE